MATVMDITTGASSVPNPMISDGAIGGVPSFPPPDLSRRGSKDLSSPGSGYEPAAKRVRSWLKVI